MGQWLLDIKGMVQDPVFLRKTVRISLPIAMQGMLNTIVNLVDNLMIAGLGASAIASVGLANKVFFVFNLLVFGISSGSGILAAQFWGSQEIKQIRKVLGLALAAAMGASVLFVLPSCFAPRMMMRIFTTSEASIETGAAYLAIVALSYPFASLSNTYTFMLRAVNQVKAPVVTSSLAIIVNIILNYVFIFGKCGMPAMGVRGAALATLAARMVEALAVLCVVYIGRTPLACGLRGLFGCSAIFLRRFLVTALPVIANEFFWGLGTTVYSMAYGRMGDDAVAAVTIATTIQDMLTVLFLGSSNAAAVILGNEMGAGKLGRARLYAKYFLILQFLMSVLVGMACIGLRWSFISLYQPGISDEVALSVSRCILVFACFLPVKMFNYMNVVGILRSGGDTAMCLFIDTSGIWVIGIPLAFLGGLVFHQPIHIVYGMVMLEEAYKAVIGYARYRQKKWLRNLAVGENKTL